MVGVPWAMAFVEEQQIIEMERTERAREVAGEVCCFFFLSFSLFLFGGRTRNFVGGGCSGTSYGDFRFILYGAQVWMLFWKGFRKLILSRVFAWLRYEC